jgi:hypothetical protein
MYQSLSRFCVWNLHCIRTCILCIVIISRTPPVVILCGKRDYWTKISDGLLPCSKLGREDLLDIANLQREEASHSSQTRYKVWSDSSEAESSAGLQAAAEVSEHMGIVGTSALSDQPRSFGYVEKSRFDVEPNTSRKFLISGSIAPYGTKLLFLLRIKGATRNCAVCVWRASLLFKMRAYVLFLSVSLIISRWRPPW